MVKFQNSFGRQSLVWAGVCCVIITAVLISIGIKVEADDATAMGMFQLGVVLVLLISNACFYFCGLSAIGAAYNDGVKEGQALMAAQVASDKAYKEIKEKK